LDPARWRELLCCELTTLLDALIAQEANSVVRMGYTNVKAPGTVAILAHEPSQMTLERLRKIGDTMPGVDLVSDGIGCANHYCEIDWSSPASSRQGLLGRISSWFAARLHPMTRARLRGSARPRERT
jgi:hypothetical protein